MRSDWRRNGVGLEGNEVGLDGERGQTGGTGLNWRGNGVNLEEERGRIRGEQG